MTTKEIAEQTGIGISLAVKWAVANGVQYIGEGKRKIFIWTESDFERFQNRNKVVGRPKTKDV